MMRLALFVEGEGDSQAATMLVRKILVDQRAFDAGDLLLDSHPLHAKGLGSLTKNDGERWKRLLGSARKRPNLRGVLLVLDGDGKKRGPCAVCVVEQARLLARQAREVGAGASFSVAVVFARQEFESWLIAGIASAAGRELADGRRIRQDAQSPEDDLDEHPRDAKGWLNRVVEGGYRPARDQAEVTRLVELAAMRGRNQRSFRRLEQAVTELVAAMRNQQHAVTPG